MLVNSLCLPLNAMAKPKTPRAGAPVLNRGKLLYRPQLGSLDISITCNLRLDKLFDNGILDCDKVIEIKGCKTLARRFKLNQREGGRNTIPHSLFKLSTWQVVEMAGQNCISGLGTEVSHPLSLCPDEESGLHYPQKAQCHHGFRETNTEMQQKKSGHQVDKREMPKMGKRSCSYTTQNKSAKENVKVKMM